jgi:hypothetical protein
MKYSILAFAFLISISAAAQAKTCAHVEQTQALDPIPCISVDEYAKRFNSELTDKWLIVEVPDGTEHNASPGPKGTWINPAVPPAPTPAPAVSSDITLEQIEQIRAILIK